MFNDMPARNRKLYAGPNVDQLLEDYYPPNTIEVNGESFHFHELHDIARRLQIREDKFHQVEAYLRIEPKNSFDPKAVAVFIHQTKIGYVNKEVAPIIFDGLAQLGGEAWVMAAIKEVTTIPQYRVRLMVSLPVQLDFRAFSLIDLIEIEAPPINGDVERLSVSVEIADILGTYTADEHGFNDSNVGLVMLHLETNEDGESEIVTTFENTLISRVLADDHDDLFDAVLEVNQAAWSAVRWLIEPETGAIQMKFIETIWVLQRHIPNPQQLGGNEDDRNEPGAGERNL